MTKEYKFNFLVKEEGRVVVYVSCVSVCLFRQDKVKAIDSGSAVKSKKKI